MHRLADVELQLVMHGLGASDLLRLARCCTRTRQLADTPFAWKYAIRTVDSNSANSHALTPSHLLRHAAVHLRWVTDRQTERDNDVDMLLHLIQAQGLRLRSLDAMGAASEKFFERHWRILVASPVMQHVHTLSTPLHYLAPTLAALAVLPIHTLTLAIRRFGSDSALPLAESLPQLTSLHLSSHLPAVIPLCMSAIAQCTQLQRLSLNFETLHGSALCALLSSPNLRSLCSLHVDQLQAGSVAVSATDGSRTPVAYAHAFANLSNLDILHLSRVYSVHTILPHLAATTCTPILDRLTIQPDCDPENPAHFSSVPPVATVAALLAAKPKLRGVLLLQSPLGPGKGRSDERAYAEKTCWRFIQAEELLAFSRRFSVKSGYAVDVQ